VRARPRARRRSAPGGPRRALARSARPGLQAARRASAAISAPPPAPTTLDAATQAFQRGEFTRALDIAERLLEADPRSSAALRIAALSACSREERRQGCAVRRAAPRKERAEARDLCDRNNIELDGDDRPGEPSDKVPDPDLGEAMRAASAGQWDQALSRAEVVLQRMPRNLRALGIGVTAACHLKRDGVARSLLRRMPLPRQRAMRQLCAREGVLL